MNNEAIDKACREICSRVARERAEAVERLTLDQFANALKQALPDFMRYVSADGAQAVVYLPRREADELRRKLASAEAEIEDLRNSSRRLA